MKLALVGRDGVINVARQGGVNHRTQLELINGSIDAIVKLSNAGYSCVIVTHQPGISRGLIDLDELEAIHTSITSLVEEAGASIDAIFYCPHDEQDRCHCRPPEMGLLDAIEMEFDSDTSNALYFYSNPNEKTLSEKKACRGFYCSEETPLINWVNHLLTEEL